MEQNYVTVTLCILRYSCVRCAAKKWQRRLVTVLDGADCQTPTLRETSSAATLRRILTLHTVTQKKRTNFGLRASF